MYFYLPNLVTLPQIPKHTPTTPRLLNEGLKLGGKAISTPPQPTASQLSSTLTHLTWFLSEPLPRLSQSYFECLGSNSSVERLKQSSWPVLTCSLQVLPISVNRNFILSVAQARTLRSHSFPLISDPSGNQVNAPSNILGIWPLPSPSHCQSGLV